MKIAYLTPYNHCSPRFFINLVYSRLWNQNQSIFGDRRIRSIKMQKVTFSKNESFKRERSIKCQIDQFVSGRAQTPGSCWKLWSRLGNQKNHKHERDKERTKIQSCLGQYLGERKGFEQCYKFDLRVLGWEAPKIFCIVVNITYVTV